MKRFGNILIYAVSACVIYSCAVEPDAIPNEDAIAEFEAWIKTYHPEAERTGLGVYILSEETKSEEGTTVDEADYFKVNYVVSDLKGQISSANTKSMAMQLGNYTSEDDEVNYYGPAVWAYSSMSAGLKELIGGMKEGETKKGAIPSWLSTSASYSTEAEYRANVTGNSHAIYEITVEEVIAAADEEVHKDDMDAWQIGQIEDFIGRTVSNNGYHRPMPGFENRKFPEAILDTLKKEDNTATYMGSVYGFYFDNGSPLEKDPETDKTDSTAFPTDTTIMINYTGRRLLPKYDEYGIRIPGEYDEQIFDTTIENLAKDAGIYSASKTYEPVEVDWNEEVSGITLGGSTVIEGFYTALWNMQYKHKLWEPSGEYKDKTPMPEARKAVAIFYSPYGYGTSGSGDLIPAYAPLMFEIEIIKEDEE